MRYICRGIAEGYCREEDWSIIFEGYFVQKGIYRWKDVFSDAFESKFIGGNKEYGIIEGGISVENIYFWGSLRPSAWY